MLRYRLLLILKLAVAAGMALGLWSLVMRHWHAEIPRMLGLGVIVWLLYALVFVAFLDHRYRCRVCLRRLRMPVMSGTWAATLMDSAATEYICPFGHGKLSVPEVHLTGPTLASWKRYRGMWQELFPEKAVSDH